LLAGHFSPAFLPVVPRTEQDNVPSDNLYSIFLFPVLPVTGRTLISVEYGTEVSGCGSFCRACARD
jgi:hypothetical protein